MPFATEEDVRKQTFWQNFEEVSSAQIQQCLETAHQDILAGTSLLDGDSVGADVIEAEVLLTVSHVHRSNALSKSAHARNIKTPGIQMDEWKQVTQLFDLSNGLADEAWFQLHAALQISPSPRMIVTQCPASVHKTA